VPVLVICDFIYLFTTFDRMFVDNVSLIFCFVIFITITFNEVESVKGKCIYLYSYICYNFE